MLRALLAKNWRSYQQVVMSDIEVTRLAWFRAPAYQDFVRFFESSDGFHRCRPRCRGAQRFHAPHAPCSGSLQGRCGKRRGAREDVLESTQAA